MFNIIYQNNLMNIATTVQLKGNLVPACRWQAGQLRADQQNLSKRVRVPTNIPNRDRQHPLGTCNQEPVATV